MSTPNTKICAVVVTYNPPPELARNLRSLSKQIPEILVVDNASHPADVVKIEQAALSIGAKVIWNPRNLGIAAALNQGGRYAIEAGFEWMATFDQDSHVTDGMIVAMTDAYSIDKNNKSIAVIGPVYVDERTGASIKIRAAKENALLDISATMASGNLVKLEAWQMVQGFDEGFFIDFVDIDFCLRCRQYGLRIVQAVGARLMHNLGDGKRVRFGRLSISATHHSPRRRYYITRNRLITWGRHWRQERSLVIRDWIAMAKELVKIVLVERQKGKKLLAVLKGSFDAIRGKRGEISTFPEI